jgi:hypothetical protein
MGVDHDGVGGIGIRFTDLMKESCVSLGIFTEEEWEAVWFECMDKIGISWTEAGSYSYGGEKRIYFIISGCKTLGDVVNKADSFCGELAKIGIIIKKEELKIIEDILVW